MRKIIIVEFDTLFFWAFYYLKKSSAIEWVFLNAGFAKTAIKTYEAKPTHKQLA